MVHSGLGKVISKPFHINYKIRMELGPRGLIWDGGCKEEWEMKKDNLDARLEQKASMLHGMAELNKPEIDSVARLQGCMHCGQGMEMITKVLPLPKDKANEFNNSLLFAEQSSIKRKHGSLEE